MTCWAVKQNTRFFITDLRNDKLEAISKIGFGPKDIFEMADRNGFKAAGQVQGPR
jgi:hypothetical protein